MTELLDQLTVVDYLIIAVIAISVLISIVRGFVREAVGLLIWVAAFYVAFAYAPLLVPYLGDLPVLADLPPSALTAVGMIILFVATLIIGVVINVLIAILVKRTGVSGTDRLLGLGFGLARGVLIVAVLILAAGFTPIPQDPWYQRAYLIDELQPLAEWGAEFLPESIREHVSFAPEVAPQATPSAGELATDPSAQDGQPASGSADDASAGGSSSN